MSLLFVPLFPLLCLLSVHFVMSAVMLSMCNISSLPPVLLFFFPFFHTSIHPSIPPFHYREEVEEEEVDEEPQKAELSVQGSARYSEFSEFSALEMAARM